MTKKPTIWQSEVQLDAWYVDVGLCLLSVIIYIYHFIRLDYTLAGHFYTIVRSIHTTKMVNAKGVASLTDTVVSPARWNINSRSVRSLQPDDRQACWHHFSSVVYVYVGLGVVCEIVMNSGTTGIDPAN